MKHLTPTQSSIVMLALVLTLVALVACAAPAAPTAAPDFTAEEE